MEVSGERASRGATATWRSSARLENGAELYRVAAALEAFANPKKIAREPRRRCAQLVHSSCSRDEVRPRDSSRDFASDGTSRTLARVATGLMTRAKPRGAD